MKQLQDRHTDQLLTVQQAERLTGRKASTWRKDILRKRIAYVKLGARQVRIPREVIDDMIAKGWREPVDSGAAVANL